jgi:hypothetical protein
MFWRKKMKKLIATCMTVIFLGGAALVFAEATATPGVKSCDKASWKSGKHAGKNSKNWKSCKKGQKPCPTKTPAATGK